jgi:hypothetical protein
MTTSINSSTSPYTAAGPSANVIYLLTALDAHGPKDANGLRAQPPPAPGTARAMSVAKQFTAGAKSRDYGMATYWSLCQSERIATPQDLASLLHRLTPNPSMMMVMGRPTEAGLAHQHAMLRTHTSDTRYVGGLTIAPTLADRHIGWLALDVDNWSLPRADMTAWDRAVDLAERIRARAVWMRGAAVVVQMSASYGFASGIHKAHCFVLLEQPRTISEIKARLDQDGFFDGDEHFDKSIYTPSQPLYTSAPECFGCIDPLPGGRVFVVPGHDHVSMPVPEMRLDGDPSTRRPKVRLDVPRVKRLKPQEKELRSLSKRLARSNDEHQAAAGVALTHMLDRRDYAEQGNHRAAELSVSMHLLHGFGEHFDADWFCDSFLLPAWVSAGFTDIADRKKPEWIKMCAQAREKAQSRSNSTLNMSLDQARESVLSHSGTFYVADPETLSDATFAYQGPYTASQLREQIRDNLHGVPGAAVEQMKKGGDVIPTPLERLKLDLCTNADAVHLWGYPGRNAYDRSRRELNVQVYDANVFEPSHSPICDEFLHAWGGAQYESLATYLSLLPDLRRPLIALAAVGEASTYKSWFTSRLAQHWGDPLASNPTFATKFFQKFNDAILRSPIVWHNERVISGPDGRSDPRALRDAISESVHSVERKFVTPVVLHACLRHVVTANHEDIVLEGFGGGASDAEARATRERCLIVHVDAQAIAAWKQRWRGTAEFEQFHESEAWRAQLQADAVFSVPNLLLRHIAALRADHLPLVFAREQASGFERFGVPSSTSIADVKRSKYQDRLLSNIITVAVKSSLGPQDGAHFVVSAEGAALQVVDGVLQLRASAVTRAWKECAEVGDSRAPDAAHVGRLLRKAGLTLARPNNRMWGVPVDVAELRAWFAVAGEHVDVTWEQFRESLARRSGVDVGGDGPLVVAPANGVPWVAR